MLRAPYALESDGMEQMNNIEKQAHDAVQKSWALIFWTGKGFLKKSAFLCHKPAVALSNKMGSRITTLKNDKCQPG